MNEPKDDLLAAFENPESVPTETPVAPVEPVAPQVPETPVIPDVPYTPENTTVIETPVAPEAQVSENIMPPEFANAPEATPIPEAPAPVAPAPAVETPVVETPVAPAPAVEAPVAPVAEAPVAEAPVTPVEDNQNVPEHVSEEPAITVKDTISPEQDDPNFLKKNLKFIILFCIIIAVFIIFLPQILSFVSGGAY